MPEAVVVRLSRFRTTRPAFDAVLRVTVLPDLRARPGMLGVFAGRQGPDEIGPRVLVTAWSSSAAMSAAIDERDEHEDGGSGPFVDTTDHGLEILSVLAINLAPSPLSTGILRVARGRLRDSDIATYADLVSRDFASLQAGRVASGDLIVATPGDGSFVMLSTWPDWTAIEAATGASISDPLRTKRLAGLDAFEADHYELLTELVPVTD